jgi:hypothetical protein
MVMEAADAAHRLLGLVDPSSLPDEVLGHASELVRRAAWAILGAWPAPKLA